MNGFARQLAGYLLDSFRERVTAADFLGENVRRVLLSPGFNEEAAAAVRRLFPGAQLEVMPANRSVWALRRERYDAAGIAMTGGNTRARLRVLGSGARHLLLLPSPDYSYRLGLWQGPGAWWWALVDGLLLAPLALVWWCLVIGLMYASGLVGRSQRAEKAAAKT